jgi:hypothetical protein
LGHVVLVVEADTNGRATRIIHCAKANILSSPHGAIKVTAPDQFGCNPAGIYARCRDVSQGSSVLDTPSSGARADGFAGTTTQALKAPGQANQILGRMVVRVTVSRQSLVCQIEAHELPSANDGLSVGEPPPDHLTPRAE